MEQIVLERHKIGKMDVMLVPRQPSGLVAVAAIIRRGAAEEGPEEHGLASFTTAMLLRGTQRRSCQQFAFEMESLGALTGQGDGADTCVVSVRCARVVAFEAASLLAEALRMPAFDAAQHEIQRQDVLAELRMQEDEKFGLTYREYLKVMFKGHGYGHPALGELEDAQRVSPADCQRWHQRAIRPENVLMVVAGDINTLEWRGMLEGLLGDWEQPGEPVARCEASARGMASQSLELTRPQLQQGFIVAGFPAPTIMDPDYPALRLASAVLGEGFAGRMFANLRDRQSLAYALGATLRSYRLGAHQVLYIGTKPQTLQQARDGLLTEAQAIKDEPVSEEQLDRARQYVIGKYLMGNQSIAQQAGNLANWEDATGDALNHLRWPDRLRAVTPAQVQEAASRWWNDPTVVTLRPQETGV